MQNFTLHCINLFFHGQQFYLYEMNALSAELTKINIFSDVTRVTG